MHGSLHALAPARPDARPAVLVAEDNAFNRDVLALQLEGLGCRVVAAEDGAQALAAWRAGPPFALLLTDLQMPGLDGFALAAAIRREEAPERRLPIVAFTASDDEAARCRAAGMDGHVPKPVGHAALHALVAHCRDAACPAAAGATEAA